MNMATCPKCSAHLKPVLYQEVEIDRCLHCGGIWFDSLEAETLKQMKGSESLDSGSLETSSPFDEVRGSPVVARRSLSDKVGREINCPRCYTAMMRMLDLDRYSIWYEKCSRCHGVWLDAGEFKKFKRNFTSKNLLHRAKDVFRKK